MNKNTKINMTYNNYISMSTNPTKEYLMISELIDNSIGSFETKNGEDYDNWPKGEVVNVVVDIFTNAKAKAAKLKKTKIHDKVVIDGSYIEVNDNAYGMDENILFESIKIDNKKIVDGSNKNVHGRGMKQAAFYFGMGLNIKTNDGNSSNELTIDLKKIEDLSSDFERKVIESNKKDRGTSIKIFNIYYSKIPTKNAVNKIIETLKTRYWKYIESGRLVVEVKTDVMGLENTTLNNEMVLPLYLNVDTVDNFLEGKERKNALIEINKLIDSQKMAPSKNSRTGELKKTYKDLIKSKIKEMYTVGNEYKWEFEEVSFGFFEEETVKLNMSFWKNGVKKNFGPYRGIYIYEGGRAIKHGPNNGAYLEWFKNNSHSSGSTDNKFFGEIDITDIDEITAVNDKSNIDVPKDIKDQMDDFIFWNWQLFDKVENFIRKDDNYAGVDFNKTPVKKKLIERYTSMDAKNNKHLTFADEINLTNDKELSGVFNIAAEKWEINILSDKSNVETSKIIDIDLDIKNKKITTFYNENAGIWNKANNGNSTEFYSNVLFPVLIQLTIQYINLIVKKLDPVDSLNNNYKEIDEGEFID